jgi:hypothetical protein
MPPFEKSMDWLRRAMSGVMRFVQGGTNKGII